VIESSHPSLFLDYFRIPYRSGAVSAPDGFARIQGASSSSSLLWRRFEQDDGLDPQHFVFENMPLFGRLDPKLDLGDRRAVALADCLEGADLALPFDPSEVMVSLWSEAYLPRQNTWRARAKRASVRGYYAVRPAMPRSSQIWVRRRFSSVQARARFPRWPIETALHDLYDLLLARLALVADEPVPWIAPWPRPYRWAMVLSHDVEHQLGYDKLQLLADIELALGYTSSWNFVPERDYEVETDRLDRLRTEGFEIGLHGLRHDGRDLESRATLERRLPAMRAHAERWGAVGFRSPATHRDWDLMPLLGVDYDSSSPDTDPYEPKSGGCCTWWPFFNRDLVELPITLTQDHTVFVILERRDDALWREKADFLRDRGGMALVLTHPDYMTEPKLVDLYRSFLTRYADDPTVWKARPRDVASWWRKRAASRVVGTATGWKIEGPAAEDGQIEFLARATDLAPQQS
jgi:peptidoglycan/xylan/chitin deacetylase (PgdA/CDA1 family)